MADEAGKKCHNNFEIKRNCFKSPLATKSTNRQNHTNPKETNKSPTKHQPTRCFVISKELPRLSTWAAISAFPWNPGSGALHRALCGKMECPVWELATSVRKLLQMVQLISCQNSQQTSSERMGTSLGLNVKLASCSVSLHFLQNVILKHFCQRLDTLDVTSLQLCFVQFEDVK